MLRVKRLFVTFNTSFVWHIENVISLIMSFSSIRDETSHTHVGFSETDAAISRFVDSKLLA